MVTEPADFARALDADPVARAAYDRLAYSHRREHVLAVESAKKPETRARRIEKALAMLRDPGANGEPSAFEVGQGSSSRGGALRGRCGRPVRNPRQHSVGQG